MVNPSHHPISYRSSKFSSSADVLLQGFRAVVDVRRYCVWVSWCAHTRTLTDCISHVSRAGPILLFAKRASCCHVSQALQMPLVDFRVCTYDSRRVRFPTLRALYHELTRPTLLWQVVNGSELIREKARAARGLTFITS